MEACLEVILGTGGVLPVHSADQPTHAIHRPGPEQGDGPQGVGDVGVQQRCHLARRQRCRLAHDGRPAGNAAQGLHLQGTRPWSAAGFLRGG